MAYVYFYLTVYDTAEIYFTEALNIQKTLGNRLREGVVLLDLGINAANAGELEKALDYDARCAAIMHEVGDFKRETHVYKMMGYSCKTAGQYPRALEYYQQALNLADSLGDREDVANCYEYLADVFESMQDYAKAISYFEKSEAILSDLNLGKKQAELSLRRGQVYFLKEEYAEALPHIYRSLDLWKKGNQRLEGGAPLKSHDDQNIFISRLYFMIASCYEGLNRLDSAEFFLRETGRLSVGTNDVILKTKALSKLGGIYNSQGKIREAIASYREAVETAAKADLVEREMEAAQALYPIYQEQKNYREAFHYLHVYQSLNDSLYNEKNIKEFARLEANYEFEKEKQQLAFEQEQEIQRQKLLQGIMLIALGIALLFIFVIYRYYQSKQRANAELSRLNEEIIQQKEVVESQKRKLEELDEAKSHFFTNISHEFRTPLTVISGMAGQIRKNPKQWTEKGSQMIERNSKNLLQLVNQILDLRKLESKALEANYLQGDVVQYLRYITESHQSLANNQGLELHFLSKQEELVMDYDPDKLLKIVSNLLSNAVKFTPEGGHIYFQLDQKEAAGKPVLEIQVKDTGSGIPEAKLSRIFDRFYQVDDSATRKGEGTGIGLALTKELVEVLQGEIEVNSTVGQGTAFLVRLPISNEAALQEEPSAVVLPLVEATEVLPDNGAPEGGRQTIFSTNLPKVLIVEDNPDVQQYLVACLKDSYQLEIANNGQEGIDQAIESVPDLIVSDVMMPEKDGFELCESLKTDERTNHIPIVLLTAKADADSRLSGFEKGADAYLSKPFEPRELQLRLRNLVELQRQMQKQYSLAGKDLKDTSDPRKAIEDPFLQKIYDLVLENLSDADYDLARLCRALGMSRSQVFRKVKALTGHPPSLFIRSIRLQQSKQLLHNTDLTISEVAYDVGFTSPNYFSAAFLEEFGMRPSETRK